jgi:hypothetical protein
MHVNLACTPVSLQVLPSEWVLEMLLNDGCPL